MRIGIVAPYDLARAGGINTHLRAQARALRARGHTVTIYGAASGAADGGEIVLGGTTTVTFGGTESGLGLNPLMLRRLGPITGDRFDVIHVHEPLVPLLPWQVLVRARVPIVGTFHVHREDGHRFYPAARPLLARLMRRIAFRIAVSEAARHTVAVHFPGAYEIVPNGIDLDTFHTPRPRPAAFSDRGRHVLYVGRLEPRKGVDGLIRAIARVQQQLPDVRLVVVGDGPDRPALESLARELRAGVTFEGVVGDAVLPACYQACDLVCSPALGGESFGIVLLEAMACAKPFVASRIDGYTALVGDSDCGTLVPPGDAAVLAAALLDLLSDEKRQRILGAHGLALAQTYDWRAIAGRLETIYSDLIARRSPSACSSAIVASNT